MNTSPFDRLHLGYESLFGPRTTFYHLQPQPVNGEDLVEVVQVPVLDLNRTGSVGFGTVLVVLAGFVWIVAKLVGVWKGGETGASKERRKKE